MFQDYLHAAWSQIQAFMGQCSLYIVTAVAVLLLVVLYRSVFKKTSKLPLPYYYVKTDVVATLEEAHRDVRHVRLIIQSLY